MLGMSFPMPLITVSESHIQKSILDYLAARHILAFRMNSGVANIDKRFIRFGVPGMADILACPQHLCDDGDWRPVFLWLECKAPKGKQSELQKSFQTQVVEAGHFYAVVRSIEDVEAELR
jgi:hypothetical protein